MTATPAWRTFPEMNIGTISLSASARNYCGAPGSGRARSPMPRMWCRRRLWGIGGASGNYRGSRWRCSSPPCAGRRMTSRAGAGDAVILKPLRPTRRAAVVNQAETTSSVAARLRNAAVTSDTTVPKNKPRTKPMADWTAGCIILRTIAVAFSAASALIPAASNFTV